MHTSVTSSAPSTEGSISIEKGTSRAHSYSQILKSTALVGGSSVVTIAFGIVRNKAMALFLGPAGVGLMGLYSSIAELTQSLASLGIQNSGVRQIAEAVGSGESDRIARTAVVLRRISILLGALGAGLLILFAGPVSQLTFGTRERTAGVAVLSVAVFFKLVSAGQGALIQGMRRIADLARQSVWAAVLGTAISIPLVYFFREDGVVPSLVAVAAVSLVASWWYSRKIVVATSKLTLVQLTQESRALLQLGLAFMASGFLTMGAAYAIRIIVLRMAGFGAAGLYQSAWTLGGLYVGFILQAMGADFYPRLTAVATSDDECNRLVNEQAHISLLLAGPGVIATITCAPLVMSFFYSAEFQPAISLLRWICLGMILRVIAWPMGFIIVAKGRQQVFFWTEVAATAVHVALAWGLIRFMGLDGAGAAFFGLYVWHGLLIYALVGYKKDLSHFRWSAENLALGAVFIPLTGLVFAGFYVAPLWLASAFGLLSAAITGAYSAKNLVTLLPDGAVPSGVRDFLRRIPFSGSKISR